MQFHNGIELVREIVAERTDFFSGNDTSRIEDALQQIESSMGAPQLYVRDNVYEYDTVNGITVTAYTGNTSVNLILDVTQPLYTLNSGTYNSINTGTDMADSFNAEGLSNVVVSANYFTGLSTNIQFVFSGNRSANEYIYVGEDLYTRAGSAYVPTVINFTNGTWTVETGNAFDQVAPIITFASAYGVINATFNVSEALYTRSGNSYNLLADSTDLSASFNSGNGSNAVVSATYYTNNTIIMTYSGNSTANTYIYASSNLYSESRAAYVPTTLSVPFTGNYLTLAFTSANGIVDATFNFSDTVNIRVGDVFEPLADSTDLAASFNSANGTTSLTAATYSTNGTLILEFTGTGTYNTFTYASANLYSSTQGVYTPAALSVPFTGNYLTVNFDSADSYNTATFNFSEEVYTRSGSTFTALADQTDLTASFNSANGSNTVNAATYTTNGVDTFQLIMSFNDDGSTVNSYTYASANLYSPSQGIYTPTAFTYSGNDTWIVG